MQRLTPEPGDRPSRTKRFAFRGEGEAALGLGVRFYFCWRAASASRRRQPLRGWSVVYAVKLRTYSDIRGISNARTTVFFSSPASFFDARASSIAETEHHDQNEISIDREAIRQRKCLANARFRKTNCSN